MCDLSGVVDDVGSFVGNLGTDTSGASSSLDVGFDPSAAASFGGAASTAADLGNVGTDFTAALPSFSGALDASGNAADLSGATAGGLGNLGAIGSTGAASTDPFSAVPSSFTAVNPVPAASVVPIGDFTGGATSGDISALQGGSGGAAAPAAAAGNTVINGGGAGSGGLFGGVGDFLANNAKWLVPAAALGYTALKGSNTSPKSQPEGPQQQQIADTANTNAQQLLAPLTSGAPLPAGAQAGIDLATQSAKSAIQSKFASMGMSGSTQEVSALNQVDQQAQSQGFQIAQQLAQTGLSEQQIASGVYTQLMNTSLLQDQQLTNAIAQFAAAAGGAGQKVNLTLT